MKILTYILAITLATAAPALAVEYGLVSYYSVSCNKGTRTASGVALNDTKLTAAHKTLPFGTKVKVTNLKNNKSVIVTITDRGPFIKKRILDVSLKAAEVLNIKKSGVAKVKVEKI